MVQALLRNRLFFLGMEGWDYTYIRVRGSKIVVTQIDNSQAKELMLKFRKVEPSEYSNYDERLGDIYVDGNFKKYINSHPRIKSTIFRILTEYDGEY